MRMILAHKNNFCVRMESLTEQEWRVLLDKIARRLVNVTDLILKRLHPNGSTSTCHLQITDGTEEQQRSFLSSPSQ